MVLNKRPGKGKVFPGMRQVRMSIVLEGDPDLPYYAVSAFWFDNDEARLAAFGTPKEKLAAEDAAATATQEHIYLPKRK